MSVTLFGPPHKFLAISVEGRGPVVWGGGDTRMAALEDARRRLPVGAVERLSLRANDDEREALAGAETDSAPTGASRGSTGFAAVADDGAGLMVWGMGATRDAARDDARRWLPSGDRRELVLHPISDAQAAVVVAGKLSWPVVR